jgi:hypothetical protein
MKKFSELSYAAWMRNQIIQNPDISLEELRKAFEDSNRKEEIPNRQLLYLAKSRIKKRWGIDVKEIPRNRDGSLNMSGMIRLFLNIQGSDSNEKQAREFFAVDGLKLSEGIFSTAKATYFRKNSPNNSPNNQTNDYDESDFQQKDKNPRARFVPKNNDQDQNKSDFTLELLLEAKSFIQSSGGIENARSLISLIEEIKSVA